MTFGFCSDYYKIMGDAIEEIVNVKAYFYSGKIFPYLISYKQREIPIKKVNLFYKTTDGAQTVLNFSLMGNGATYNVVFYPLKLLWKLIEIKPI